MAAQPSHRVEPVSDEAKAASATALSIIAGASFEAHAKGPPLSPEETHPSTSDNHHGAE